MKCQKFWGLGSSVFGAEKRFFSNFCKNFSEKRDKNNKRDFRADGLPLHPSALRPRLLDNRGGLSFNVAKIVVMTTILGISGLFLINSSTPVLADSLTLTIPSTSLSLGLNPTENNGFATTSSSFSIKTDNLAGYTVSIKSKNADNSLVNGNNKITPIAESTTESNFKNDAKFANMWGWLPSKLNSENNSNYQIAPNTKEIVLDVTKNANAQAQSYNISLAAKINDSMPSGAYTNTFVISASANAEFADAMMQDWDGCDSLEPEQSVRLLDNRDNNVYTVTKLKDGKCWMTENLRITGDSVKAAGVSTTLDSTNTDISGSGKFTIPDSNISEFNVGGNGYSTTEGKNNDAAYVATTSYSDPTYGAKSFDSGYYTWHTATAGTGTADQTTDGWNAPSSICPKGWKLPTGGSGGDFQTLTKAYGIGENTDGSNTLRGAPLNFTYAGGVSYSSGVLYNQGSYGYYWSSTVYNQYDAYNLYFRSSTVNPTFSLNRPHGSSVRCVARQNIMQTVSDWGKDLQTDQPVEAVDVRDGNTYTVSKLKDGKIWMTSNLRIAGQTLTPDTSDVDSNYELPSSDLSKFYKRCRSSTGVYVDQDNGGYYTQEVALANDYKKPYSICPKGWRPPTQTEFDTMVKAYGSNALQLQTSVNLKFNGYILDDALSGTNDRGYYWTSTVGRCGNQMSFKITSSSVGFIGNSSESDRIEPQGAALRCIARGSNDNYDGSDRIGSGGGCSPTPSCEVVAQ